jgi:hypothetical protein
MQSQNHPNAHCSGMLMLYEKNVSIQDWCDNIPDKDVPINDNSDNLKNVCFLHERINCHYEYILLHKTDMKTVQGNEHNNDFSCESPLSHTGYIGASYHSQPHVQKFQSCAIV